VTGGSIIVWAIYLGLAAAFLLAVGWLYSSAKASETDDPSGMIGQEGTAQETFTQEGRVLVRGELWKATSDGGIVQKGDTVRVQEVRAGLVLVVHRIQK
jgi:membrane protein implicated in regulation of membrane protease activity